MVKSISWKWLLALVYVALLGSGQAQNPPQPMGTVQISSTSVAAGVGVNWGDGTLHYKGSDYKFSLTGLSVADLGVSTITARGEVFNLTTPADLSGNYVAGAAGLAVAGGADDVIMKNDHGVVIHLKGTEQGVRLQLGAQGLSIKLKS
ncbi:MAG: hypothetical protein ABSF50_23175 [Burkholderiaceae bacterium]|jgi:hypothetical protein